jgi:hypothetical protein
MVWQLPKATPGIASTPIRYYVVGVVHMFIRQANGDLTVLLVDTGGRAVHPGHGPRAGQPGHCGWGQLRHCDPAVLWGIMPADTAARFSSALDVGIMRNICLGIGAPLIL